MRRNRGTLGVLVLLAVFGVPHVVYAQSSTDAGPATPPENERHIEKSPEKSSGIKRKLGEALPDCIRIFGVAKCKSESEPKDQEAASSSQPESQGEQDPLPTQPIPRSGGTSSSRDTKIGFESPAGPGDASTQATEMHPWDPHKAQKDVEVGEYYLKRGNYKAAISRFREALQWKPGDAPATFRLAEALEKDGQLLESRTHYEAYMKLMPEGEFTQQATQALERLKRTPTASVPNR